DQAATWACRNLPAKNTLTAEDAQIVEERFRARLSTFGDGKPAEEHPNLVSAQIAVSADPAERAPGRNIPRAPKKRSRNADVRALGKIVRLRDKEHRRFVARQPCLVCGRAPCDAHHLTFTQPRALGSRVSDEFIVPVCRIHHRELHRHGNEAAWWQKLEIDPLSTALRLWQQTRANDEIAATKGEFDQSHIAHRVDISPQNQDGTTHDRLVNPENSISKGTTGGTK